jgi:hypothetical protein
MTRFSITTIAVTVALGILSSAASADSNYGPRRKGDQCWKHQLGNSFGYWETCKDAATATGASANATVSRPAKKNTKSR